MGTTGLPLDASPEEIRKAWGPGDAGSLLEAALTWSRLEQLDPVTQFWIVHLWAPGLALLEVPLIWMNKFLKIPLFWSLLLSTLLVLQMTHSIFRKIITSRLEVTIYGFILLTLLLSWDFKYILRDGMFYTEGIGYLLLISGLGLLTLNVLRQKYNKKRCYILPGFLIGISIWIRHVSDTSLLLLTFITGFIYFVNQLHDRNLKQKQKKLRKLSQNQKPRNSLRLILASALVAILVTMPWRLISQTVYNGAPLVMSSASASVGEGLWIDGKKNPDYYWIPYNMNWACDIDQAKCDRINEDPERYPNSQRRIEAVKSALANPIRYTEERGRYLLESWIPGFVGNAGVIWKLAAVMPLLFAFLFPFLLKKIRSKEKWTILLIWLPFIILPIAQLLMIHFESRYFLPIRLLTVGLFLSLLTLFLSENDRHLRNFDVMYSKLADSLVKKL